MGFVVRDRAAHGCLRAYQGRTEEWPCGVRKAFSKVVTLELDFDNKYKVSWGMKATGYVSKPLNR